MHCSISASNEGTTESQFILLPAEAQSVAVISTLKSNPQKKTKVAFRTFLDVRTKEGVKFDFESLNPAGIAMSIRCFDRDVSSSERSFNVEE